MDFRYVDYFGNEPSTGYERLLHDCMIGDATLFQRGDMVEQAWKTVTPILAAWQAAGCPDLPSYPAGTAGPKEADSLLGREGRRWRPLLPATTEDGENHHQVVPDSATDETRTKHG